MAGSFQLINLKKDKTVLYQTASVMLDTIISYRFGKPNVSKDIYDYLLNNRKYAFEMLFLFHALPSNYPFICFFPVTYS